MKLLLSLLSILVLSLPLGCLSCVEERTPVNGQIVFTCGRDGNDEIYVMNTDGSNQINISRNSAYDYQPACSLDGRRIGFVSWRDTRLGHYEEIYIMEADGSDPINISNSLGADYCPTWCPCGKRIAFARVGQNYFDIYVMNFDGSDQKNIS